MAEPEEIAASRKYPRENSGANPTYRVCMALEQIADVLEAIRLDLRELVTAQRNADRAAMKGKGPWLILEALVSSKSPSLENQTLRCR
jgi:hypothetical protein